MENVLMFSLVNQESNDLLLDVYLVAEKIKKCSMFFFNFAISLESLC
jgi:hypothetical protein